MSRSRSRAVSALAGAVVLACGLMGLIARLSGVGSGGSAQVVVEASTGSSSLSAVATSAPCSQEGCGSGILFCAEPGTIFGTAGNDVLIGTEGDDVICGLGGDDRIEGRGGNDSLSGDSGNDTIIGGAGDDAIAGDEGNDYIKGSDGQDNIAAGDGDDRVFGGADNDIISGNEGNDFADGGPGTNECYVVETVVSCALQVVQPIPAPLPLPPMPDMLTAPSDNGIVTLDSFGVTLEIPSTNRIAYESLDVTVRTDLATEETLPFLGRIPADVELVDVELPSSFTIRLTVPRDVELTTDLAVAYVDAESGMWETLPTTIDTATRTVAAEISHLSTWTIIRRSKYEAYLQGLADLPTKDPDCKGNPGGIPEPSSSAGAEIDCGVH